MYEVTPSILIETLKILLSRTDKNGNPKPMSSVMIWGAMGVGKTDIITELGKNWNYRIVQLHLPQYDPTDIKGIPVKTDDGIRWVPSNYLPQSITLHEIESTTLRWPYTKSIIIEAFNVSGDVIFRTGDPFKEEIKNDNFSISYTIEDYVNLAISGNCQEISKIVVQDKAILFLDELSSAVPETQKTALQLSLDRRVGEWDLPESTPVVAAGNRETDAAFTHDMSGPLANRFCHIRLVPSVTDWVDWALNNNIRTDIISYIQWKKDDALFCFNPDTMKEGDLGFPTPRSWNKLSQQLHDDVNSNIQNIIITGYIGSSVGMDFIGYRKLFKEKIPSIDNILQGNLIDMSKLELKKDIGLSYACITALAAGLKNYHDQYYDIDKDRNNQCDEWNIAIDSFLKWLDINFNEELNILCLHFISKSPKKVCLSHLRMNEVYKDYSKKYASFYTGSML